MEDEPFLLLDALQDDQLMTKREILGLKGSLSSKTGKQGTEHH
jgi:hypothetical protein